MYISEKYRGRQNSQCKGSMRGSNVYVRNSNKARTAGIEEGRDSGRETEITPGRALLLHDVQIQETFMTQFPPLNKVPNVGV